ncbi:MAG: transglutaminase family protein [Candidatus Pseudobacter hemicellulosilyticus]|uniref:Transglutaminase family protein n=1 Tax=Candidatus Pseudobacter hemicellulosilyticus TaxID=3121375 RepID=A0AAJ5WXC7_9BACT|nr:MAG: transglutaminase family protein [Pseudobacter sp.]
MPAFIIHHITRYLYDLPVIDSANQIMLFPLQDEFQDVTEHTLAITGDPVVDLYADYYGNQVGTFMHSRPHQELVIDVKMEVVTQQRALPAIEHPIADQWNYLQQVADAIPYIDFVKQERFEALPEVAAVANMEGSRDASVMDTAYRLMEYVYRNFEYNKEVTTVETTLDEIWRLKAGVCQDFAHILLAMLRMLGIPARYVSGYVCPHDAGMRGEGATHAWVEACIPFYGWLGFDPTNNCIANEQHVRLAVGRNFTDCSPVKGTYRGTAHHRLEVGVSVAHEEESRTPAPVTTVLMPQPIANNNGNGETTNSYRKHVEMMMQQQQQQQ